MKKSVIFDTALCTTNLGDEIILESIYNGMKDIFNQGTSVRLGTHVKNFNLINFIKKTPKLEYCLNADYKFVCGTNLFSQKKIGKINPQWEINLVNKSLYKNAVLIGVGATDDSDVLDAYAKYLYSTTLSKKFVHSVRDEYTKKLVESAGLKAINTGCPTLWSLTPEHCSRIPVDKSENCIFTFSGYGDQKDPKRDRQIFEIIKKNYNKLYAWIQTTVDEEYIDRLIGKCEVTKIYTLDNYKEILRKGNVDYIGTRLHGGVYALQNGCRTIVISIDKRARGFHESNDLPIIERVDAAAKLNAMINSSFETKIRINEKAIEKFKAQFREV